LIRHLLPRGSIIRIAHEEPHAVLSAYSQVGLHRARSAGEVQRALPHWPRHTHQSPPSFRLTAPEAASGRRGESASRLCRHVAQWCEGVTVSPPRRVFSALARARSRAQRPASCRFEYHLSQDFAD
jgi:hypothetical protein